MTAHAKQSLRQAGWRVFVVFVHVCLWAASFLGAYLLRFDGTIPATYYPLIAYGLSVVVVLRIASFWWRGLFHSMFRYAGIREVRAIVEATLIPTIGFIGLSTLYRPILQPRSIYAIEWVLAVLSAAGLRLGVRLLRERGQSNDDPASVREAILIGGGDAGEMFLRDLERVRHPDLRIIGILDDDPRKHGSSLRGVRILGGVSEKSLRRAVEDLSIGTVILAMPTASGARVREILDMCHSLKLEVKTLPSLQAIISGDVKVSMLRDVAIEDLLRREPIKLNEKSMAELLRGRRVLVTGGAGSIGSELARQAAAHEPAGLILLDHNENGLFFLERELRASFPRLSLDVRIGDVKDAARIRDLLEEVRPHVVLHAAAHKHVPMMEANPGEAVKNNVFGTAVMAELSAALGVETFVLISTDKAVNPTSVMGATKRIAEMFVQSMANGGKTRFAAVRFGNVLGSAGSVVQLFREQIAKGGPVMVTHPDMCRYFMTIPEATQLVLQAAALAKGGEIFVLDMGEPVKIVDLARDMIRMSGFQPDVDIPIVFSGLRPGEKLFEELFHGKEGVDQTLHPKIFVGVVPRVAPETMREALLSLADAVPRGESTVRSTIRRWVPEAKLEKLGRAESTQEVERVIERLSVLETLPTRAAAAPRPSAPLLLDALATGK